MFRYVSANLLSGLDAVEVENRKINVYMKNIHILQLSF